MRAILATLAVLAVSTATECKYSHLQFKYLAVITRESIINFNNNVSEYFGNFDSKNMTVVVPSTSTLFEIVFINSKLLLYR